MKKELRRAAETTAELPPRDYRAVWITAAFGACTQTYLAIFFIVCPERLYKLELLLLPDELVLSWCGGSFSRFAMLDRLPILGATAFIFAGSFGFGRLILAALRTDKQLTRLETVVFSCGLGLHLLSLYTLAVGLCGGLRQPLLFVLPLVAGAMLAVGSLVRGVRSSFNPEPTATALEARSVSEGPAVNSAVAVGSGLNEGWLARFGMWLAAPFVLVTLLGSMLPPWDFDVREYHLQVPKEWYQSGSVSFLPHNVYGNMPLGAEMHSIVGTNLMPGERNWWWGALVGKTVMAGFTPLTALALFAAGKRMFSATAGVVAALVYLSIPWITHVSISGLNEGVSAFYWFTAGYAVWMWMQEVPSDEEGSPTHKQGADETNPTRQRGENGSLTRERGTSRNALLPRLHVGLVGKSPGLLVVAGLLAGGAVACKYPAVLFVVVPLAAWILIARTSKRGVLPCAVFLLAVAASCGLWLAKNVKLTGNPVYPLAVSVFGGETRTSDKDLQWRKAHVTPSYSTAEVAHRAGRVAWRSELLSPLLWPLAMLAFCLASHRRNVLLLVGFLTFVIAAWWLFTHRIDRFWVPALPFAALLSGAGATWSRETLWKCLLAGFLAFGLLFNFLVVSTPSIQGEIVGDNRYLVSLDALRLDEPQNEGDSSRVDPAHRYLNRVVAKGNAVLLVGDATPFDLEVPALYNTCFDDCLFETLLRDKTRAERRRAFQERRISHVYIAWREIARYRSPGNYGFTDYVTRELIHKELIVEQHLLRRVECGLPSGWGEVFEVVEGVEEESSD